MAKKQEEYPVVKNPLSVIPIKPDNLEIKYDSKGMMHLRLSQEPSGMLKHVVLWLRYDYSRKIELDEYGTAYYSLVDGKTNLRQIIDKMNAKFDKSREEIEQAVILFTKKLMQMQMILLKVPASATGDKLK
ncbi:MAG: PqqD family peptide modification chaperone [bacterium]